MHYPFLWHDPVVDRVEGSGRHHGGAAQVRLVPHGHASRAGPAPTVPAQLRRCWRAICSGQLLRAQTALLPWNPALVPSVAPHILEVAGNHLIAAGPGNAADFHKLPRSTMSYFHIDVRGFLPNSSGISCQPVGGGGVSSKECSSSPVHAPLPSTRQTEGLASVLIVQILLRICICRSARQGWPVHDYKSAVIP